MLEAQISHKFHSHVHLKWDNALEPVLTVNSGDTVTFDLLDGGHNQFTPTSTAADIPNFNFALGDPAHGPIYIRDAKPGDVLAVEFLDLEVADYGWTAIFPGSANFGLLADEFPAPELKIWDLATAKKTGFAVFKPGIEIPLRPFLGVVGVARGEGGEWSTIPPYPTGGNIDTKHITRSSTLYLPIACPGALFSIGDGHAAQGDGEVCGTAIETPMRATVKLTLQKSKPWLQSPHYLTPKNENEKLQAEGGGVNGKGHYGVLGVDKDLREASRKAVRGMVEWLVGEKGLAREEGYMLCSVAGDLKIAEAVDMPHYAVACSLPLSVFVGAPYV